MRTSAAPASGAAAGQRPAGALSKRDGGAADATVASPRVVTTSSSAMRPGGR